MNKKLNLHLVSDSTGDTVINIAKAVIARFTNIEAREYIWPLVKSKNQMEEVISAVRENPGVVMYTIFDKDLKNSLREECLILNVPCISVLSQVINEFSAYLDLKASPLPANKYELDDNYFSRIDAVNYAIAHDDGQSTWDIDDSDMIIIGPSRTSKSPTCMYLAYRGYRAANIPYVSNCNLPDILYKTKKPLIFGLTMSVNRLITIRQDRLIHLGDKKNINYVDGNLVRNEIEESKKLYARNRWPIIDVTRKSVEEVAAKIIQYHNTVQRILKKL